jgi:hypothetical protein
MLTTPPEHLDIALARLEASDRALLELSLRRRIPDHEIAGLLHVDTGDVGRRREAVLDRLAHDVDAPSTADLADLLSDTWGNGHERAGNGGATPQAATVELPDPIFEEASPIEAPDAEPLRAGRRGYLVVGSLVAILGIALVVAILRVNGKDEASTPAAAPARPAPAPAPGRSAALRPVAGIQGATGSARLLGADRIRVSVKGLPSASGAYTLWLYDNVANAVPLGNLKDGKLTGHLPKGYTRFGSLDVSVEPRDRNANHSGASVLRAPLSALTR